MSTVTAVVDAHVHIHACYEPDQLLSNAYTNLSSARGGSPNGGAAPADEALFLLMTECAGDDYFGALYERAQGRDDMRGLSLKQWAVKPTDEQVSVVATSEGRQLNIVAGAQIACREGLEVLVLGTRRRVPDGRPIREVLAETDSWGVPRVIPWGPGKWFFRRGRLLHQLVEEFRKPTLFLGDEGGRPIFWGYPEHFGSAARLGVRDLPGTDPLPFPHDVTKVGRMGFRVRIELDPARPAASLFSALRQQNNPLERFAILESPLRFVRNQIGMQLRKRRLA
jgi:hypothetical protein